MSACFVAGTQVAVRPEEGVLEAETLFAGWEQAALWTGLGAAGVAAMAAGIVTERKRRQQVAFNCGDDLDSCRERPLWRSESGAAADNPADSVFGETAQDWLADLLVPMAERVREDLADLPQASPRLRLA